MSDNIKQCVNDDFKKYTNGCLDDYLSVDNCVKILSFMRIEQYKLSLDKGNSAHSTLKKIIIYKQMMIVEDVIRNLGQYNAENYYSSGRRTLFQIYMPCR